MAAAGGARSSHDPVMRRVAGIAVAVGLAVVLGGCAGGMSPATGSAVAPSVSPVVASASTPSPGIVGASSTPAPAATAPDAPPSPTQEAAMVPFALTSTAFDPGGPIPRRHTCDGADVSPALAWGGVPAGSGALVLVVDDPDARDWVHWLVLDLPGSDGSLAEGVGARAETPAQGRNDFGRRGWGGPCPPSGTHRYVFTLYALATPLGLAGEPDGAKVRKALDRATVLGRAVLEGTYRRGG